VEPENRHTCSILAGIHPFRERIKIDGFGARESPLTHVHLSPTCYPFRGASKRERLDLVLAISTDERVSFDEFGAGAISSSLANMTRV
jgi:hypothetical protein